MYDQINHRITELNSEKDGIIAKLQAAISINSANFSDMAKSFDTLVMSNSQISVNPTRNSDSRISELLEHLTKTIDSSFLSLKDNLISKLKSEFSEICADLISPMIADMRDRYDDLVRNQNDLSARIDEVFIYVNDAATFNSN